MAGWCGAGGGSLHVIKVRESWQAMADFNIWPTESPNTTLSPLNFLCCCVRLGDRIDVVSFWVSPISSMSLFLPLTSHSLGHSSSLLSLSQVVSVIRFSLNSALTIWSVLFLQKKIKSPFFDIHRIIYGDLNIFACSLFPVPICFPHRDCVCIFLVYT